MGKSVPNNINNPGSRLYIYSGYDESLAQGTGCFFQGMNIGTNIKVNEKSQED